MKVNRVVACAIVGATCLAAAGVAPSAVAGQKDAAGGWDGRGLFVANCASCHGTSGTGNGPVAASLRVRPGDLTKLAAANGNTFPSARTQRIIDGREVGAHGNPDMPVWGTAFKMTRGGPSEEEIKARIAAIVRYLESIQERKG